MRCILVAPNGTKLRVTSTADAALTDPCTCGCEEVRGSDPHLGGHDYYSAAARCVRCGADRGELRAYLDTVFGLDEDQRLLEQGRCRVY